MILDHPGQKLKLCLAAHHGNFTPPRISPSCPFRDRSTNAGAVIARQIGHDLLSGRSDPLPTFNAAFMQVSAQVDLRAPSSVAAHSLSLQGTPTDVFQFLDIHFTRSNRGHFPVSPKAPSLLIQFRKPIRNKTSKTSHNIQEQFQLRQDFFTLFVDPSVGQANPFCIVTDGNILKINGLDQLPLSLGKSCHNVPQPLTQLPGNRNSSILGASRSRIASAPTVSPLSIAS